MHKSKEDKKELSKNAASVNLYLGEHRLGFVVLVPPVHEKEKGQMLDSAVQNYSNDSQKQDQDKVFNLLVPSGPCLGPRSKHIIGPCGAGAQTLFGLVPLHVGVKGQRQRQS